MREQNAVNGLRCLQQLGRQPDQSLDSTALARAEGLELAQVSELLVSLGSAGFVEAVPDRPGCYRLTRPPGLIRVAEVWASLLERAPAPGASGPTLQQVIDWEERAFRDGNPAEAC
jgi:DNA-binding IscR family transcriptional regulator